MRIVAIIPARGGSKGIPKKNLATLGDQTLLARTVGHARESKLVGEVYVSTDDPEIAREARDNGAQVIVRPEHLSADMATSENALLHALDIISDGNPSADPDLVVFLQATSPLRASDDIDGAITWMISGGADSLFSATRLQGFVWRIRGKEPYPITYDPKARPMRQGAYLDVLENGSIYIFRPWVLRALGCRLGGKIVTYLTDPLQSFQVDEPEDLELIRKLLCLIDQ